MKHILLLILSIMLIGCVQEVEQPTQQVEVEEEIEYLVATFAGGCFWCTESDFEKQIGVIEAESGYIGGNVENPTYKQVSSGTTGHAEAVKVTYDPSKITYRQLLDVFWKHHDPTDAGGSFVDRGQQYRSGIFYHNEEQRTQAEQSKADLDASGRYDKPVITEITEAGTFYSAEEYHQDYHKKNPIKYKFYRSRSGRDDHIQEVWGEEANMVIEDKELEQDEAGFDPASFRKPTDEELKQLLSPLQYEVTQEDGTEKPFENEYNENKEQGIYVDIVSGEPLFSSLDKYDSGTGWPSFTKPLAPENVVEKKDFKLIIPRTEVRSKHADSHLGHVFKDGPEPTGLRYCMNSASMEFIPMDELEERGYGEYMELFK